MFTENNKLWMLRGENGHRPLKFKSPQVLWKRACDYFQWCHDNPLYETVFVGKEGRREDVPKMRAMTWQGLELFLGITTLKNYRNGSGYEKFHDTMEMIDKVIYTQKFEGAAAGLLNPNLIGRELGLVDKKEVTGSNGEAIKTELTIKMVHTGPEPASNEKELNLDPHV